MYEGLGPDGSPIVMHLEMMKEGEGGGAKCSCSGTESGNAKKKGAKGGGGGGGAGGKKGAAAGSKKKK